jgi:2-polyprenyl-6-methoxyphenol hydroxylase-like FAD-dependent oxidoreductase
MVRREASALMPLATDEPTGTAMRTRTVLISGAGVGGPTLAYWLARRGFQPTIVERATGLRSSGNPVDVKGPALEVAKRMGILPQLRAADSNVTHMVFVNGAGRRVARVNLRSFGMRDGEREPEVARADLATLLLRAVGDDSELVWNDSIASIDQDDAGVNVTFDNAEPRRFDLVIGADGLHSNVRRLAFGPEADFVRHMGLYVATLPVDAAVEDDSEVILYNTPGRLASIHPAHGRPVAAFMFRSPTIAGLDHRDTAQHKRLVADAFADDAWRVPDLLEEVDAAEDVFFDSVSLVRLPQWSTGRVALLGDAASSLSLFGDGSTLAIAGAYTLAEELAATPEDYQAAFCRYERRHRTLVDPRAKGFAAAAALMVPATGRGILLRNAGTRLIPASAAIASLARRLRPAGRRATSAPQAQSAGEFATDQPPYREGR